MGGAMAAGCAHFASGVDADGPAREPSDRRYAPLCRNVVEQQRVRLLYGAPRFARRACGSGVSVGTTRLSSHEVASLWHLPIALEDQQRLAAQRTSRRAVLLLQLREAAELTAALQQVED